MTLKQLMVNLVNNQVNILGAHSSPYISVNGSVLIDEKFGEQIRVC